MSEYLTKPPRAERSPEGRKYNIWFNLRMTEDDRELAKRIASKYDTSASALIRWLLYKEAAEAGLDGINPSFVVSREDDREEQPTV